MNENSIIIVPDIHGRVFWKSLANMIDKCKEVIFLGDYFDPYRYEGITEEETINNFKEILEFKKQYKDKVTLLIGNHDCGYLDTDLISCRHDFTNHAMIEKLFKDNIDLFQIGTVRSIKDKTFTFTHGALMKNWIKEIKMLRDIENNPKEIIETLNDMFHKDFEHLVPYLGIVGYCRGGWKPQGSVIWGDMTEIQEDDYEFNDVYQIFGHTQLNTQPNITDYYANLDCRRMFELTENGEIKELE